VIGLDTWFLDTGFVIAVASRQDQHHAAAQQLYSQMRQTKRRLLTTDAVLFEIGAAFSKVAMRQQGLQLINALLTDDSVEVVSITEPLRTSALQLFAQHADKDWSLCDCLSIALMRARGMDQALTPDHHFAQAGMVALMLPQ
jgi:uncharacterized protein